MRNSSGPEDQHRGRHANFVYRLKVGLFLLLMGFLVFVAGGVSTFMKAPGMEDFIRRVSVGLFYIYASSFDSAALEYLWRPTHTPGPPGDNPVVFNDSARAQSGYTLVTNAREQAAVLVDMAGNPVHKWGRRFDEIWEAAPHVTDYQSEDPEYWADKIYWRHAELYPNGDILVIFETPYLTPYGLGLAKLDKDSNLIWKLDKNVHHDTATGKGGEIYTLGQRINDTGYKDYPDAKPPFIDDTLLVVSSDGKLLKEISLIQAFVDSPYSAFLSFMSTNLRGDVMHANTVQYIDTETARAFPFAEEGDLLISLREMGIIALLDPVAEKVTWAQTGPWLGQHEPVMLDNGNIVLFDNRGNSGDSGASRVIEFDPLRGATHWSYTGTASEPLDSPIWGMVQRLKNGNTLILESTNGRAVEVTQDGRIVWDYRSPHRKRENGAELVRPILFMERFNPENLTFLR